MDNSIVDKNSLLVNPDLLIWARNSIGFTLEEVAKKLGVDAKVYEDWEKGKVAVPLNKLKVLSIIFKRPSAIFLLNKAPDEKLISAFRKLFELRENTQELTKQTLLAIRRAFRIQRILVEELDFKESSLLRLLRNKRIDDATDLVKEVVEILDIDYDLYLKPKDSFEQLNLWKKLIESMQIVVLEEGFPADEARGFVINHTIAPVVVLNTKDSPYARIFTLLHEFCHILIGEDSVDDNVTLSLSSNVKNEIFCNSFAGNILAPSDFIESHISTRYLDLTDGLLEILETLSKHMNVSKDVVARRLLDMGYINEYVYKKFLKSKPDITKLNKKKTIGGNYYTNYIKNNGMTFISEVLNAFNSNKITYSETIDYLGVKPKTFEKLVPKVLSRL